MKMFEKSGREEVNSEHNIREELTGSVKSRLLYDVIEEKL